MGRAIFRIAVIVFALAGLTLPVRAAAGEPLFARSCVLASARPISLDQALASSAWRCNPDPGDARAPYLWLRIGQNDLPSGGSWQLQSDAMPLQALTTVLHFAGRDARERHFDAAAIARHWTSGTRFSLPLYSAGERPTELFVRIERPFDKEVATSLQIERKATAQARELRDMILFGVFVGMLFVVALYSCSLFVALRTRFALAHAAMVLFFLQYTLASSSLVFQLFPGTTLWQRTGLAYSGFACSMAMLAPFVCSFLERSAVGSRFRSAAYATAALTAAMGLAVPVAGPQLPFVMRTVYNAAFIPGMLLFFTVYFIAWRNRSRAIRLIGVAWSVPLLFGFDRIARALGLYRLPFEFDFAFFAAMAFQAIVMTFAISWRIGEIRKQRDRALEHGDALARIAETDALTGLPNRRSFDARHWRAGDFLAIVDLDHFKRVNDRFGHATGDEVLRVIGAALNTEVEGKGVLGAWRMGGEEFTVLVAARSVEAAALAVNRLRGRIGAAIADGVPAIGAAVTASAGLARIDADGIEAAYESADRALYHAKASGRDRLSWEAADREKATIFPRRRRRRAA